MDFFLAKTSDEHIFQIYEYLLEKLLAYRREITTIN